MRKRPDSKLLAVTTTMPALSHWPDKPAPFPPEHSEVLRWLGQRPDLVEWFFGALRNRELVVFDPTTHAWRGRDTLPTLPNDSSANSTEEGVSLCISPKRNLFAYRTFTGQGPAALKACVR